MITALNAPSLRARTLSAAITGLATLGVAVAATLVLGLVLMLVAYVTGDASVTFGGVGFLGGRGGGPAGPMWGTTIADSGGWLSTALLVAVVAVAWLGSCRLGVGTPGDAVMALQARDHSGERVGRSRNMARTATPVAIVGVAVLTGHSAVGLGLAAVLWAPALVRRDRRTAYDLVAGVVPHSTEPRKTSHGWTEVAPGREGR